MLGASFQMSKQQSIRAAETRGFLFTNIATLVWKSTTMSTVYNDLCSLHIFSPPFSTFTHFYLFFFLFGGGRAISFQNNLFHHLTMKSKIGYRSLVMTIILTVIFSKKELLIKRKKKKKGKSNTQNFDYWKIEIIRNYNNWWKSLFIYLFIINSFQWFRFLLHFEILAKMLLILISLTFESYHKQISTLLEFSFFDTR